MGTIKSDVFYFDENTNYTLTIKFDKTGFYVNGHKITRDDFEQVEDKVSEVPYSEDINPSSGVVWTFPDAFMPHFQGVLDLSFGSMEGSTRSFAYYEYIMYHHKL